MPAFKVSSQLLCVLTSDVILLGELRLDAKANRTKGGAQRLFFTLKGHLGEEHLVSSSSFEADQS